MRTWSFADAKTGLFIGTTFSTYAQDAEAQLAANTRDGWIAVEGSYDHLSQRLDLSTGEVIDDPDLAHSNAQQQEREQRHAATLARIEALERTQQRPLRELAIDPGNAEAKRRIAEIDNEIGDARKGMQVAHLRSNET